MSSDRKMVRSQRLPFTGSRKASVDEVGPTVETEMRIRNHSWGTIEKLAKDRQKWKSYVAALHASGHNG